MKQSTETIQDQVSVSYRNYLGVRNVRRSVELATQIDHQCQS